MLLEKRVAATVPVGYDPESKDKPQEECAVFGLYLPPEQQAAFLIYFALFNLQHRGQDASGIATSDGKHAVRVTKDLGLVSQVYTPQKLARLRGHFGIGHNRYTTSKVNTQAFAQPTSEGRRNRLGKTTKNELAVALNGNISNPEPMVRFLLEKNVDICGKNDTMLMSALLWYFLQETQDIVAAIKLCWPFWIGAFSLVIVWKDQLIGVRGPHGIRPLVLGEMTEGGFALASESCAWNSKGRLLRSIRPGEVMVIDGAGIQSHQVAVTPEQLDAFELVYFGRPDSMFTATLPDGSEVKRSIYQIRRNFGQELWNEHQIRADIVVPVPDSANQAAEQYAQASGVPYCAGLVKSRYVHRTFIQPSQELRELAQTFKLNPVEDQLAGKDIVLIDDSIVRGTTLIPLIKKLKEAGARKVSVLVASPPVKFPDFYGIATPQQKDLIAAHKSPAEIAAHIGADGVYYLSVEGMVRAIGVPKESLMTSAFTGEYPIDIGKHQNEISYPTL
jgi:amidophosphoribosyltransferase